MSALLLMPVLLCLGIVLIVALCLLGRFKVPSRIEYGLAVGWIYVRLVICLIAAVGLVASWLYMVITMKAPNGRQLVPGDLLWLAVVMIPLALFFVRVGRFGKRAKLSSLREDRAVQRRRFERYGRYE